MLNIKVRTGGSEPLTSHTFISRLRPVSQAFCPPIIGIDFDLSKTKNCFIYVVTSVRVHVHQMHSCMSFMEYEVTGTKRVYNFTRNDYGCVLSVLPQAVPQVRIFVCLFAQKTLNPSSINFGIYLLKYCYHLIRMTKVCFVFLSCFSPS